MHTHTYIYYVPTDFLKGLFFYLLLSVKDATELPSDLKITMLLFGDETCHRLQTFLQNLICTHAYSL